MMDRENIAEKFDHLAKVIQMPKFLKMEALGGEIPFFISTYNPIQTNEIKKSISGLKNKLDKNGVSVLEIDLYGICMNILNEELGEGEIFEIEKDMEKDELKNALQSLLDIPEVIMPNIKSLIEANPSKVYFLTGIGNVYPFIRSHNILNNLQNVAKQAPTVMFFPGIYTGQSLELFGKLKDDNYYRAFNLDNYKI